MVNFGQIYERSKPTSWVDWQNKFDGLLVKPNILYPESKKLSLSTGTNYSSLISNAIIAPIAILRGRYPLSMDMAFPAAFLDDMFEGGSVDCTRLSDTDLVFETIGYK